MDIYRKKNDSKAGKKRTSKAKTIKLKVNHPKKISKSARRLYKKKNREETKGYITANNLEGKYGEVWIWSAIDPESKYLFPDITGTRSRNYGLKSVKTMQSMRSNTEDDLLIQTDNYDVYDGIIKECFAEKIYSYFSNRRNEKIPKEVKMPDNILHAVIKKKRNSSGEIEEVDAEIKCGAESKILKILNTHNPTQGINTSYIERCNLNRRHFNARLRRKTIAFSRDYDCLTAQLNLQRLYSNFCWKHRTLTTNNGYPTSPAMQVGATDCIWSLSKLMHFSTIQRAHGS